jgi:glutamate-1-semialdehyde 2,1-aminomutase
MGMNDSSVSEYRAPKSQQLFDRACKVMPRGNSRHSIFHSPHPIYAVTGQGCRVIDADGIERLDFINNYSSTIHGHGHPAILAALQAQAAKLIAVGLPTETEIELAELLCGRIRSVEQVRFMNSGTEAVMMAIKAARAFTGRPKIAKFEGCYHGTYDSAEISQAPGEDSWGPLERPRSVALSRGTPAALIHDTVVLPFNDVSATRRILEEVGRQLAGIIVDSTPAHLGYLQVSSEMFKLLREFADAQGVLLIMDEVYSLRLDYHGAQHRFGVKPDLTVMGKIIGGGLAIGAVGGSREVLAVFDPLPTGPAVVHGGTYNANPLSMATGLASMRLLTAAVVHELERLGQYMREQLRLAVERLKVELLIGGVGSLISLTFAAGPLRNYRDLAGFSEHRLRIAEFHRGMLSQGVLLTPQGLAILSTPMGQAEIDAFIRATEVVLRGMYK